MRDQILALTQGGHHYIDLYTTNTADIRRALLTHPALWTEGFSLLQLWQPNLQARVDGKGSIKNHQCRPGAGGQDVPE